MTWYNYNRHNIGGILMANTNITNDFITLADGKKMPKVGFGVYKLTDSDALVGQVSAAYQAGYRLFDTAQLYHNEAALGTALAKLNVDRDDYFVTTKITQENQGYDKTIASAKESLQKLGLDYVDLLLVHWPLMEPFFDTWRAMEALKKAGLTKSIGVSNYTAAHLELLKTQADEMPVVNQIEIHPTLNQLPMVQYDQDNQIVTQAWSPLGRGYDLKQPVISKIAQDHHRTNAQVILRWELQHGICVIPKSAHPKRIAENSEVEDFQLPSSEMKKMDSLNKFWRTGREPELVYEYGCMYQR